MKLVDYLITMVLIVGVFSTGVLYYTSLSSTYQVPFSNISSVNDSAMNQVLNQTNEIEASLNAQKVGTTSSANALFTKVIPTVALTYKFVGLFGTMLNAAALDYNIPAYWIVIFITILSALFIYIFISVAIRWFV